MRRRTIIIGILALLLAVGAILLHVRQQSLTGALGGTGTVEERVRHFTDANADGTLTAREMRRALVTVIRGVISATLPGTEPNLELDVNDDSLLNRADITEMARVLRAILACGNGTPDAGEQCDDGNTNAGDGCSAVCATEDRFTCTGSPSQCVPSLCGNGVLDPGEEFCDDGNTLNGDGCSQTCALEIGFSCDQGSPSQCAANTCIDTDSGTVFGVKGTLTINRHFLPDFTRTDQCMSGDQTVYSCTDPAGTLTPHCFLAEWSDDPVCDIYGSVTMKQCDCFNGTCVTWCGDRQTQTAKGEVCDDGNETNGDGCDATCHVEATYACTSASPSVCTPLCGNGTLDVDANSNQRLNAYAEQCDDHNAVSGDGCSQSCAIEPGYGCIGTPSICSLTPAGCGNGTLDPGEECDDGNASNGSAVNGNKDGCSAICTVEPGFVCAGIPSHCDVYTCQDSDGGNNFAVRGTATVLKNYSLFMQSDDACQIQTSPGVWQSAASCSGANCYTNEANCSTSYPFFSDTMAHCTSCTNGVCANPAICGNGILETGETCDDGNTMSTDGCSTACQVEAGYICTGTPSQCALGPVCGNGTIEGTEQCDDGNTNPDDVCGNNCLLTCGDHNLGQYEECDDGNTASGDGCSSQCTVEPPLASIAPFMWTRETSIPVGSSTFSEYATTVALGKIWVLGGLENGALSAAVYATADGDSWSQMGLLPDARYSASVTEFNGELWVVGGMNCGLKSSCTFQTIYHSPDGAQWTQGPSLPSGTQMVRAPLYVLNGTLFVLSGNGTIYSLSGPDAAWQAAGAFYYTEPRVTVFNNAVWMLSGRSLYASADGTTNWQLKSTLPSSVQTEQYTVYPGNLVPFGGKLVVLGNADDPAATVKEPNCFKVLLSSGDGIQWSKSITSPCWEPIRNHAVLSFLGKLWLLGEEFSHGDVFSAEPVLP